MYAGLFFVFLGFTVMSWKVISGKTNPENYLCNDRISGYLNQLSIQVALGIDLTQTVKNGQYTGTVGKPGRVV